MISDNSNDQTTLSHRVLDVRNEPLEFYDPISGLEDRPVPCLAEAISPLRVTVRDIYTYLLVAEEWVKKEFASLSSLPQGMSHDQAVAIHLYTREWTNREDSLYIKLNQALRSTDRGLVKPFFLYLRLFLSGLELLPSKKKILWRGIAGDVTSSYTKERRLIWWGISSCSIDSDTSVKFLGEDKKTLFMIESQCAVNISRLSRFPKEKEFILPPARLFEVKNIIIQDTADCNIVQLKEITPRSPLIHFQSKYQDDVVKKDVNQDDIVISIDNKIIDSKIIDSKIIDSKNQHNNVSKNQDNIVPLLSPKKVIDKVKKIFRTVTQSHGKLSNSVDIESETDNGSDNDKMIEKDENLINIRLCLALVGSSTIGKSAFIKQYLWNKFDFAYEHTIEEKYPKQQVYNGVQYIIDWFDLGGEFGGEQDHYIYQRMITGQGFILGYSITNRNSFDQLINVFYHQILDAKKGNYFPGVVVGNKCDLEDKREVTTKEGADWAKENGFAFFETSACTGVDVDKACQTLIEHTHNYLEKF